MSCLLYNLHILIKLYSMYYIAMYYMYNTYCRGESDQSVISLCGFNVDILATTLPMTPNKPDKLCLTTTSSTLTFL